MKKQITDLKDMLDGYIDLSPEVSKYFEQIHGNIDKLGFFLENFDKQKLDIPELPQGERLWKREVTNKHNLSIFNELWLGSDEYKHSSRSISSSAWAGKSAMEWVLSRNLGIKSDIADVVASRIGTACHKAREDAIRKAFLKTQWTPAFIEKRFWHSFKEFGSTFNGSGQADLVILAQDCNGLKGLCDPNLFVVEDMKTKKHFAIFKKAYGTPSDKLAECREEIRQLSMNRWLMVKDPSNGITEKMTANLGVISYFAVDFSKYGAQCKIKSPCVETIVPLIPMREIEEMFRSEIPQWEALKDVKDPGDVPEEFRCSKAYKDQWRNRQGFKKCPDYCSVSHLCPYSD